MLQGDLLLVEFIEQKLQANRSQKPITQINFGDITIKLWNQLEDSLFLDFKDSVPEHAFVHLLKSSFNDILEFTGIFFELRRFSCSTRAFWTQDQGCFRFRNWGNLLFYHRIKGFFWVDAFFIILSYYQIFKVK